MAKVVVVIPAMNEEKHIRDIAAGARKCARKVIVVDDGSTDRTAELARKARAEVIRIPKNMGKGFALRLGVIEALNMRADIVVIMDGDGQHRPEDIEKFVNVIKDGYDAAYGQRMGKGKMPLIKIVGNKGIAFMFRLLFGFWPGDILCGFKAFTADAAKAVLWKSDGYSVEPEIMAKSKNISFARVPIPTIYIDKFKGTTVKDGLKLGADMVKLKLRRVSSEDFNGE